MSSCFVEDNLFKEVNNAMKVIRSIIPQTVYSRNWGIILVRVVAAKSFNRKQIGRTDIMNQNNEVKFGKSEKPAIDLLS